MNTTDPKIKKIMVKMQNYYGCHTVILYESHTREEATETSDYDIIAIRERTKKTNFR
jgi:predicted nucleotidyltransferase